MYLKQYFTRNFFLKSAKFFVFVLLKRRTLMLFVNKENPHVFYFQEKMFIKHPKSLVYHIYINDGPGKRRIRTGGGLWGLSPPWIIEIYGFQRGFRPQLVLSLRPPPGKKKLSSTLDKFLYTPLILVAKCWTSSTVFLVYLVKDNMMWCSSFCLCCFYIYVGEQKTSSVVPS